MAISVCVSRCQILFRINTNARSCGLTKLNNSGQFFLVSYKWFNTTIQPKQREKCQKETKTKTEIKPTARARPKTKQQNDELFFKTVFVSFSLSNTSFFLSFPFARYEMYAQNEYDTRKEVCLSFIHRNSYVHTRAVWCMCACVCARVQ